MIAGAIQGSAILAGMNRRELLEALILLLLDRKKASPIVSQAPSRTIETPPADMSVQRTGERQDYRGPESTPVPHQAP